MFCLFSAFTSLSFDIWQFPCQYSAAHFQSGLILISLLICLTSCYAFCAKVNSVTQFPSGFSAFFRCNIMLFSNFTFLALLIYFLTFSAFIRNIVFLATILTPRAKTSRPVFSWIKLRSGFFGFAFVAELCYNLLRHNCLLLLNSYRSGPVSGYNPFLARLILSSQTTLSTIILGGYYHRN